MRSYNRYIGLSHWLGAFAFWFLILAWLDKGSGLGVLFVLVQFMIAIMQLLTGIQISTGKTERPEWLERGMANYWLITFGYFVLLIIVAKFFSIESLVLRFYLFGVPWIIAIYQYSLISRLKCSSHNDELSLSDHS